MPILTNREFKLTVEMIPETSFFKNVRSSVSAKQWDLIRKECYARAEHKCEVCGKRGQGKHAVECHEIWEYLTFNKFTRVQKLTGLIALCPECHLCKHPGMAEVRYGRAGVQRVIAHLCKVNEQDTYTSKCQLLDAWEDWRKKSLHQWKLDLSFLDTYLDASAQIPQVQTDPSA